MLFTRPSSSVIKEFIGLGLFNIIRRYLHELRIATKIIIKGFLIRKFKG